MFFPLALPFKVCECDVFMAVFPVHTIAPCFHLVYEVLSACGCFSAVHDRKGCILHITFHFSLFGLLQEVVCFFIPRNSFFSFFSGECLSLFRNMKPLLPALLIAPVFQVLQIRFAPLQLVTILIIHAVHYKMAVSLAVFLISLAVSVYFAEPIRAVIPINLLLLLILVHIVYVLIRWYVKGCKRSRGYY